MSQIYKAPPAAVPPTPLTIDGDTGSVTGNPIIFTGVNSGTTFRFVGSGDTMDLNVSDANSNMFIGPGAGKTPNGAHQNVGFGSDVGASIVTGGQNSFFGAECAASVTTGSGNTLIGFGTGASISDGSSNTLLGTGSGANFANGNLNIIVGYQAGSNYLTNESQNILLGNLGVIGDSALIRIGTVSTHTSTTIAGQILGENGTSGAPNYSFIAHPDCGMLTDGTNTYIAGAGFATGSFGFNVTLSGGITTTTQGVLFSGIDTKTADFTTAYGKYLYLVDVTTGGAAITVQLVSSPIIGQMYVIKDSTGAAATHNITISGTVSGVNIDGATTLVININYGVARIIFNGTEWNQI